MDTKDVVNTILAHGREMRKNHCPTRNRSLMFPPAPRSKFVDKFPENVNLSKREQMEIVKQKQYESEVKVYRALENVNIGLIVFHSFSYTHGQFGNFVRKHSDICNKKDQEEEGECDFLAIHDQFLAVMEVKAPDLKQLENPDKSFKKNLAESKRQRRKTRDLIFGIRKRMKVITPTVIDFTIFSDVDRCWANQCHSYKILSEEEKERILFADDLTNMQSIFSEYVKKEKRKGVHERISSILLGLWSFDDLTGRKKSENVLLSEVIQNVDRQLRTSKISRAGSKNIQRPVSSLLAIAPKNLRKLDITYITKEQESILKNDRRKLWINGPAGSGKTLLIVGKISELLEGADNRKAIVVVLNDTVAKKYKYYLRAADIASTIIYDHFDDATFEQDTESRVFIVYFKRDITNGVSYIDETARTNSMSKIIETGYHIFLDDFHGLTAGMGFEGTKDIYKIAFTELRSDSNRTFWVTYDILQDGSMSQPTRTSFNMCGVVANVADKDCVQSLSAVLRNSHQLAGLLKSLRELRVINEREFFQRANREYWQFSSDEIDSILCRLYGHILLHEDETGHFIHGPKPESHVLLTGWSNTSAVVAKTKDILKEELLKLRSTETSIIVDRTTFWRQDRQPVRPDDVIDWRSECENLLKSMNHEDASGKIFDEISVNYFDETFSAEWPAIIGIVELSSRMFRHENWFSFNMIGIFLGSWEVVIDQLISKIYITVSRARVYCCLILILRDYESYIDTSVDDTSEDDTSQDDTSQDLLQDNLREILYRLKSHTVYNGEYYL